MMFLNGAVGGNLRADKSMAALFKGKGLHFLNQTNCWSISILNNDI